MVYMQIHKRLHGSQGVMDLDIDIQIQKGTFISVMGASGAGKTTLLRILAGLEKAEGTIEVEGESWLNRHHALSPQKRGIGFVFQDYALFENMSVKQNLLFVNNEIALADELLSLTGLSNLASRSVTQLSGGQKQRVALCRAMMQKPKLLLMDEPFSALDSEMKERLSQELVKLHTLYGTTTVMVSHDADITYALADRVLVLHEGKIVKDGTPKEVFTQTIQTVYTLEGIK